MIDYSNSITMESHSHFSDKSMQDNFTTYANMLVLLDCLLEKYVIKIVQRNDRTQMVKGNVKSEKRETNSKLRLCKHHVQQAETGKFLEVSRLSKKRKRAIMDC